MKICGASAFVLACIVWCAWVLGAFVPPLGRGRPADVYFPDGTVIHTTFEEVFGRIKRGDAYMDRAAGGVRYKAENGMWGIAISPEQPHPDAKNLADSPSAADLPKR